MSCPAGKIRRKGSHVRTKSGKRYYRKSTCVPDKGKKGKTPKSQRVLPKLEAGFLTRHGYKTKDLAANRRKALEKAIKATNYRKVVGHVNVLANYTKRSIPTVHRKYRADVNYMIKHFKPKYSVDKRFRAKSLKRSRKRKSRKRSKRKSRKRSNKRK